jgi:hypothetical protein
LFVHCPLFSADSSRTRFYELDATLFQPLSNAMLSDVEKLRQKSLSVLQFLAKQPDRLLPLRFFEQPLQQLLLSFTASPPPSETTIELVLSTLSLFSQVPQGRDNIRELTLIAPLAASLAKSTENVEKTDFVCCFPSIQVVVVFLFFFLLLTGASSCVVGYYEFGGRHCES